MIRNYLTILMVFSNFVFFHQNLTAEGKIDRKVLFFLTEVSTKLQSKSAIKLILQSTVWKESRTRERNECAPAIPLPQRTCLRLLISPAKRFSFHMCLTDQDTCRRVVRSGWYQLGQGSPNFMSTCTTSAFKITLES